MVWVFGVNCNLYNPDRYKIWGARTEDYIYQHVNWYATFPPPLIQLLYINVNPTNIVEAYSTTCYGIYTSNPLVIYGYSFKLSINYLFDFTIIYN